MRMKSQLSLIISFQVETSLTIVLFLLLSPLIIAICAEQGLEIQAVTFPTNAPDSRKRFL